MRSKDPIMMGLCMKPRSRGTLRPSYARIISPSKIEGAGNAGCPMHPRPRVRWVVKYAHEYSQRRHRNRPAFPTQWFYGVWRALPGDEFVLPPSSSGLTSVSDPVGPIAPPRNLTPATGARTTRFDRPQHCRSSCAPLSIAHELPRPATSCAHDTVASIASRAPRS